MWLICLEHRPMNQRVTGFILGPGTCLGFSFGPGQGICERRLINVSLHVNVSLPLSLPPFPSL